MSKKIIALTLAILFIATAFTACKQKYETIEIDGEEYALATDDEGNTIVDEEYQIAVLVTDDRGKPVTDVNGDNVTNVVYIWGDALNDGKAYSEYAAFNILEGWESAEDGSLVKTDTDGQCTIKCVKACETNENYTFEDYLVVVEDMNNKVHNGLIEQGFTIEKDKTEEKVDGRDATCYAFKVVAKDGTVAQYVEYCYFEFDNVVYNLKLTCTGGAGYDSAFDYKEYIKSGFEFIEPVTEDEEESNAEAESDAAAESEATE